MNKLTPAEESRYRRHLVLPEVGRDGQELLKQARVLIVGAGGLGSPAALYLAAAGVGTIGIVDDDVVDITNLQRQIIHSSSTVGVSKVRSAEARLRDLNPHAVVIPHEVKLTSLNALEIIEDYGIVIDGTDNFPARYLINDACVLRGKVLVYGSIFRFEGQVSVFAAADGPCYRCLYPAPPPPGLVPSCEEGGVLGVLPGIIGSLQALEAVKLIIGKGETLSGRLLLFDALRMSFRELHIGKDPECPICGEKRSINALIDYEEFCGMKNPESNTGRPEELPAEISPDQLHVRLAGGETVYLLDVREQWEFDEFNINGHLIPLGQLPGRLAELDPSAEIVVYCRTGRRSGHAVDLLRQKGFSKARNLVGGMVAWKLASKGW